MQILPWISPRLSQSLIGVLTALGYAKTFGRGEVLYESPRFFDKLFFIQRGLVGKSVLDPIRQEPLVMSIAGSGGLCGAYENLYVYDRIPRLHVALAKTEALIVNTALLLQLADRNPVWQMELSSYASMCALSDRLGMVMNHSKALEERFGALALLLLLDGYPQSMAQLKSSSVDWVAYPIVLPLSTMSVMLNAEVTQLRSIIRSWTQEGKIRYRQGKVWIKRDPFYMFWLCLEKTLYEQSQLNKPSRVSNRFA